MSKGEWVKVSSEALREVAEWEEKAAKYSKAVEPVLQKWSAQWEKMFKGYSDELAAITQAHGFGPDLQQKIIAEERTRFAGCKHRLFSPAQNSSVKLVRIEASNRKHAINLSEKIVLIQAVVRRWLARRRFKEIQKNERQRNKVAFEILETEKTYVKNLEIVNRVFLQPLRQLSVASDPLITPEDLSKIFANLEIILSVHAQLLASLQDRMSKWSRSQQIGDIFVTWAPYLKFYTQYVGNYNTALATLAECKKKDEGVEAFFKDCSDNPETAGKYFGDYQIMPVQRIPRYEMLIKELFKYTHKTHPDYANLENALSKIQAVASKINESKRVAENLAKLLSIQGLFAGKYDDLVQPYRNFLREGTVFYDNPRKSQRGTSRKSITANAMPTTLDECYAFLMTDILILAYKKTSLLDDKMFRYSRVANIQLLHAVIEPIANTRDAKFGFTLTHNHVSYSLYFDSVRARDDWLELITKAATDIERNTSTLRKEIEEPELSPTASIPQSKESRFSTLIQMAGELLPTAQPPSQFSSTPINLNPPSPNSNNNRNENIYSSSNNSSNNNNNNNASLPPPMSLSSSSSSPQPSRDPRKLSTGNSYVNLNSSGSPMAVHRPPQMSSSKIKQALALYEEVYQLELAVFQVPIDLKTLFPQYYQQLPPNYQQLIWSRVFALRQKIEQIDALRDRIVAVLKSEKLATQLEHVISEGKTPVGNLQSWVKDNFPAANPTSQQPRALLIALVKWLQSLLKAWEQIVEEECT